MGPTRGFWSSLAIVVGAQQVALYARALLSLFCTPFILNCHTQVDKREYTLYITSHASRLFILFCDTPSGDTAGTMGMRPIFH
jgi:hypothetical protein